MMADETQKASRLGRGLAALLGDVDDTFGGSGPERGVRRVPVEFLRRNPRNPRSTFPDAELQELTDSIRERGIIQPIVVRSVRNLPDVFEIIAGERRWRAAQRAELHDVPVVVVEADDKLALELAIIENVQRTDLNPLDEATGYELLVTQHGYSQTDLASSLGKSRSHVANMLRLLKLPPAVRTFLADGRISAGHGRALLALPDPEAVADRIVEQGLTVRDIEKLGREQADAVDTAAPRKPGRPRREVGNADTRALEKEIAAALGLTVQIEDRDGRGEIRVRYETVEQLDAVARRLRD